MKELTGIDQDERVNEDVKLSPEEQEPLKKAFEHKKQELQKKFASDPLALSKIILEEKTL